MPEGGVETFNGKGREHRWKGNRRADLEPQSGMELFL